MNDDHFAVVIGLWKYPGLKGPPPADLQGPPNDAQAVCDWLRNPTGGGLPETNVKLYTSATCAPPDDAPAPNQLNAAMRWLNDLAQGKAPRIVGERLYLYCSGHGFAPRQQDACLVTGNAYGTEFNDANITPTAWLDWLMDAGFFGEYVLWMDCCMDRITQLTPAPPPFAYQGAARDGPPPGQCVIFAAPPRQRAVELPIAAGGGYSGVFTQSLIQGLEGAACDERGMVTASSLFDWLRIAQFNWLDPSNLENPVVAKEPRPRNLDDGVDFGRDKMKPRYQVTLRLPRGADAAIRLWSGRTSSAQDYALPAQGMTLALEPGLYLVDGAGLRHGFCVTRPLDLALSDQGAPVQSAPGKFTLRLTPDPSDQLHLYDANFTHVAATSALIEGLQLPRGLYLLRQWTGRQLSQKVLMLDADTPAPQGAQMSLLPSSPEIVSAAPLPGTRTTHEYHQQPASGNTPDVTLGEGAQILVMARRFTDGDIAEIRKPWVNVTLVDAAGAVVADLSTQGRRSDKIDHPPDQTDDWAACLVQLPPGAYALRYPMSDGTLVSQSLIAPAGGWRLEAYLLDRARDVDAALARALLMRPLGGVWGGPQDLQLQKALISLGAERPGFNAPLADLLLGADASPLAKLVGAHLLLLSLSGAPDQANAQKRFDAAVVDLQRPEVLGKHNPDVAALSLACTASELTDIAPLTTPPLFERSWRLLLEACKKQPDLISADLWLRVGTTMTLPPYFVWSIDADVQAKRRAALLKALASSPSSVAPAPRTPAPEATSADLEATSADIPKVTPIWEVRRANEIEMDRRLRFLDLPPAAWGALKAGTSRGEGVSE